MKPISNLFEFFTQCKQTVVCYLKYSNFWQVSVEQWYMHFYVFFIVCVGFKLRQGGYLKPMVGLLNIGSLLVSCCFLSCNQMVKSYLIPYITTLSNTPFEYLFSFKKNKTVKSFKNGTFVDFISDIMRSHFSSYSFSLYKSSLLPFLKCPVIIYAK